MRENGAIFLVGMMGAGKSTVGPLLAQQLGRKYVDTDREIERASGCPIAEIFRREGESAFRALERGAIAAAQCQPAVVALGGGAIAVPGAAAQLEGLGTLVYLRATPETLLGRIDAPETRPLLRGLDAAARLGRLRSLLTERESAYARARIVVDTDAMKPEEVARELAARLGSAASGLGGAA